MAIYTFKKYKISLQPDSKKTQGLRTGDIVRRQYLDGTDLVYSLMCVLSYGKEEIVDAVTNEIVERNYFIGALLEGDVPQSDQLLDFVRITNLFDTSRSGAMYLTGSDDQAPFMDVIDGIGRNASLSWPENIASPDYADAESQYVVSGVVDAEYLPSIEDNYRVLHLTRQDVEDSNFVGIQQDFYKYVQNPNRVLVSYKVKASKEMSCTMSLGYQDGTRIDGEETYTVTTDWQYRLHAVTIDYSGRYLRTLKLDLSAMEAGDEVWIADFNIILLSSIANFGDASKMRVGKLTGISDPVFGQLDGYGGYMQKLFASKSAHISGTLTAGDENGFASTFYAGRIHRNTFINSLDIDFITPIAINTTLDNPTGIGNVYQFNSRMVMNAQTNAWLLRNVGKQYTFSFWLYAETGGQISVLQNNKVVGTIQVAEGMALSWSRYHVTFELQGPQKNEGLALSLSPSLTTSGAFVYFVAPQLELGDTATQYQPTDSILNETNDYGAWFNRGGIGGTIQNPLLRLNYDGEGSIDTRTGSILLKTDGSGHLANANIKWTPQGDVTFGKGVKMTWDNFDSSIQEELVSKSIQITGPDTFTLLGDITGAEPSTNPSSITLTLEENNIQSTSSQRQWYYLQGYDYIPFEGENGKTLTIMPFEDYWGDSQALTIRCSVTINGAEYVDVFTIKRQYIVGYTLEIVSSQGITMKNGVCQTTLTANVYYQGKLVDPTYVAENYTFLWTKYHLPDIENPISGWADAQYDEWGLLVRPAIDTSKQSITLNYAISGQDYYVCELLNGNTFPYEFPIIF